MRHGFAVLLLIASVGCGSTLSQRDAMLSRVPGETPYFVGLLEPMPEARWELASGALAAIQKAVDELMQQYGWALTPETVKDDPWLALIYGIAPELKTITGADGARRLGFEPDGPHVLYGFGLLPVLRMTLTDGAVVRATIERVAERMGRPLPAQEPRERDPGHGGPVPADEPGRTGPGEAGPGLPVGRGHRGAGQSTAPHRALHPGSVGAVPQRGRTQSRPRVFFRSRPAGPLDAFRMDVHPVFVADPVDHLDGANPRFALEQSVDEVQDLGRELVRTSGPLFAPGSSPASPSRSNAFKAR